MHHNVSSLGAVAKSKTSITNISKSLIKQLIFLIKTKPAIAANECYGALTDIKLRTQSISVPIFRFRFAFQALRFWKRNNLITEKRDMLACSKLGFG